MLYLQLALFGACVGVASGLLGIGGGVILVPGLMLLFSFSQQEASGTSLAALIPPIGIFAAMVYYQNGLVKIPVAGAVAAGFMFGALGGALLLPRVSIEWLRLAFGGLLLYLGFSFVLLGPTRGATLAALPAGLAGLMVAVGALLRGRRISRHRRLPLPDNETEYHI
jgi:uncharacterized membrane protein YfcA